MKVTLVTVNQSLSNAVRERISNAVVNVCADFEDLRNTEQELLVVDGALVPITRIQENSLTNKSKILYLVTENSSGNDEVIPGVTMIQFDGRPGGNVVDEINRFLTSLMIHRNVITFWGPVSGSGTTMTAMTVMQRLPSSYRSLYLSLTDVPGIEYAKDRVEGSVSDILPRLISGVLHVQEIVSICKVLENNKYYLGGINSFVDVPSYSVDDIKRLISMAAGYFDFIVIDAGYSASLMAIAAMAVSSCSYIVTTPSAVAAMRYEQLYRQVYGNVPEIDISRFKLVSNFEDRDAIISNRFAKTYGIQRAASLRAIENTIGIRAGYEGAVLYDLDTDSAYRKEVDTLVGIILSDIGISVTENKKNGRHSFLSGLLRR